jgi:hypothetical protein
MPDHENEQVHSPSAQVKNVWSNTPTALRYALNSIMYVLGIGKILYKTM